MAKVIVPVGPLGLSAQRRVELESRVVSMAQTLPQPANKAYCHTESLAQNLWLIGIDVWIFGKPVDPNDSWWFTLRRGFALPTDIAEVWTWENILPLLGVTGSWSWHGYGCPYHMHWDMMRLYKGQSQRFGAAINITGPTVSYFQASFEISEG
ncbi:unnamed protein product [marine sediment metagenome]|uniref:Uncharacterized protein n=1 Tax=marine sediment metagenome TaxID=412755 RepID=X1JT10_9ZZZZ